MYKDIHSICASGNIQYVSINIWRFRSIPFPDNGSSTSVQFPFYDSTISVRTYVHAGTYRAAPRRYTYYIVYYMRTHVRK